MPVIRKSDTESMLDKITVASQQLNSLSTDISRRVCAFEEWLNQLPGKVVAATSIDIDKDNEFILRFSRWSGGKWRLSYAITPPNLDPESESEIDFLPLSEGPIEEKLRSIDCFPRLLSSILRSQDFLIRRLNEAQKKFDEFAKVVGITFPLEGK